MLIYNGQIIAGGGTIVLPMTRAEYEANKTILDSADVWVDLTDEPDQVAEADQIAYSVDNVQKGMGYIGDIATKAIAKVEPSDTALYVHAVGEYFINKDGELCRTTSAIQVGQTITVGTNCAVKSVGGEINDINNNLSKHGFGTAVDLKNVQTPYTIPSDGYLHYSVTNGTSYFLFLLNGLQVVIPEHSTRNTVNFIYVRQGMEIRGFINPEEALTFEFLPLV